MSCLFLCYVFLSKSFIQFMGLPKIRFVYMLFGLLNKSKSRLKCVRKFFLLCPLVPMCKQRQLSLTMFIGIVFIDCGGGRLHSLAPQSTSKPVPCIKMLDQFHRVFYLYIPLHLSLIICFFLSFSLSLSLPLSF